VKIAILGTRGIPNHYGGFEQFAEYISIDLVKKGHEVTVYNSHLHPYQEKEWKGVSIIHKYDSENRIGTAGQFIYDLNCILDCRRRGFDIILQLGYTSSSIWGRFLPKKARIITNMDGLEWKRTKYSKNVQTFLLYAEKLAVKFSDHLVADSIGIKEYLRQKYLVDATYIPYGTEVVNNFELLYLEEYGLKPESFLLLIARLEPENSIEIILDGYLKKKSELPFLVIGNYKTKYGQYLVHKYSFSKSIRFLGGIYDIKKLNVLRRYCSYYFHGHTVGGTNPSLLEAMGSGAFICAHDNIFNYSILKENALYFTSSDDVVDILSSDNSKRKEKYRFKNLEKAQKLYSWNTIADSYEELFTRTLNKR